MCKSNSFLTGRESFIACEAVDFPKPAGFQKTYACESEWVFSPESCLVVVCFDLEVPTPANMNIAKHLQVCYFWFCYFCPPLCEKFHTFYTPQIKEVTHYSLATRTVVSSPYNKMRLESRPNSWENSRVWCLTLLWNFWEKHQLDSNFQADKIQNKHRPPLDTEIQRMEWNLCECILSCQRF